MLSTKPGRSPLDRKLRLAHGRHTAILWKEEETVSDLTLLGKGPSAGCLSPRLVRRGSEWPKVTLN